MIVRLDLDLPEAGGGEEPGDVVGVARAKGPGPPGPGCSAGPR